MRLPFSTASALRRALVSGRCRPEVSRLCGKAFSRGKIGRDDYAHFSIKWSGCGCGCEGQLLFVGATLTIEDLARGSI